MSNKYSCPNCDFTTESEHSLIKHCAQLYSDENNPFKVECVCNYCGEEFFVSKQRFEKGRGIYCSKECKHEIGRVNCECNYCGKQFTVGKHNHEEIGVGKYCSKECESKGSRVKCECEYCEKKFTIEKSHYENGRGVYCSVECMDLDRRSSNPNIRESAEYQQWRQDVLERDSYQCVDCGNSDNLQTHHIIPIKEDNEKATNVDNGLTVCANCHASRHQERGDSSVVSVIKSGAKS